MKIILSHFAENAYICEDKPITHYDWKTQARMPPAARLI